MTMRIYTSLDTGAPVLTGTLYNRIRSILMACLVNGYSSKPAAGWTVGHQSADGNGFSLSNGDGIINFVYSSTQPTVYQVYLMESITDGSTALAGGVNRRSAAWLDGSSSGERQTFYHTNGVDTATNPHWLVAADEKTAIIVFGGGFSVADITQPWQGTAHYFGRYINPLGLSGPAEFVSLGGSTNAANGFFGNSVSGTSLRNPFTGLVEQGATARYTAMNVSYAAEAVKARTKLQPARLSSVRCALMCNGVGLNGSASNRAYGGLLRGLVAEPALCGSLLSEVLAVFGVSNTWQARVQPLTLPDGRIWYPVFPHATDQGFFISTDPADWS